MKRLLLTLSLTSLLVACGKDDSKPSSNAAMSELEGVWGSDCLSIGSLISMKVIRTFMGTADKSEVFEYSGTGCAFPALRVVSTLMDKFKLGDATAAPVGARKIDYTVMSFTRVYKDKTNADMASKENEYGYSDWQVGVAKDIAGKRKQPTEDPENVAGDVIYSIIKSDGKTFQGGDGATGDGSSNAKRPTSLASTVFTKQ